MYVTRKQGDMQYVMELRLCCVCCRIFCLNFEDYFRGYKDGVTLYQHVNCPPLKQPPLRLGYIK